MRAGDVQMPLQCHHIQRPSSQNRVHYSHPLLARVFALLFTIQSIFYGFTEGCNSPIGTRAATVVYPFIVLTGIALLLFGGILGRVEVSSKMSA